MSNVEASSDGWTKKPPISDRECIYKCLHNCEFMSGLDKLQVQRLMKEFEVERPDEAIKSEYPQL